ncbi:hypothetical protein [Paraburkholderia franconis]|uniref:hypothetical protein n=1 Tax=Paraburkholderia franconis TaxID=2654983 RepID=UPI00187B7109|nr:hypothetical protein [Paraburkholderia franconis]
MNDRRRKIIHAQRQRLEALKVKVEELKAEADSIRSELEAVRDDEQEAFDNMSASRQSGERGQNLEASVDNLDTAIFALDEIEDLTDLVDAIEALGNAENGQRLHGCCPAWEARATRYQGRRRPALGLNSAIVSQYENTLRALLAAPVISNVPGDCEISHLS